MPLAARIAAGDAAYDPLPPGHAVRIFTGAPLPPGADTVVAQEDCEAGDNCVRLPAVRQGDHVRRRGEELVAGTVVLRAGQYLRARLEADAVGKLCVVRHPRQGSAMLTAAPWSDGLAVIEAGRQLARGEGVTFLPYE